MKTLVAIITLTLNSCIMAVANRVFPKPAWRWSHDGRMELDARKRAAQYARDPEGCVNGKYDEENDKQ